MSQNWLRPSCHHTFRLIFQNLCLIQSCEANTVINHHSLQRDHFDYNPKSLFYIFESVFFWYSLFIVDCVGNVMAYAQKPDLVFRRNGRVNLNRRGRQFSRLLAAELCASAVVMLDTPCSEVVGRVLAIHSIRQFPLHFPSRASPCAITFQLGSNNICVFWGINGIDYWDYTLLIRDIMWFGK
jgi:hypothetical protein